MVDERVMQIADDAAHGTAATRDDALNLLGFDGYSVEAAYVCARARQIGERACHGIGLIEGQIGVDANPCPENCKYCSFAAIWVDAGCDPRGRGKGSSEEWIVRDVRHARRELEKDGWTVPARPDFNWLV